MAARKFKKDVILLLKDLSLYPYRKRSIYFENENISDLIFKGYTIVYLVKPDKKVIEVFGLIKYKEDF